MYFHVGIKLFAVIELLDTLFAFECKAMSDEMSQNITLRFIAFLAYLQLIWMCVLDMSATRALNKMSVIEQISFIKRLVNSLGVAVDIPQ